MSYENLRVVIHDTSGIKCTLLFMWQLLFMLLQLAHDCKCTCEGVCCRSPVLNLCLGRQFLLWVNYVIKQPNWTSRWQSTGSTTKLRSTTKLHWPNTVNNLTEWLNWVRLMTGVSHQTSHTLFSTWYVYFRSLYRTKYKLLNSGDGIKHSRLSSTWQN